MGFNKLEAVGKLSTVAMSILGGMAAKGGSFSIQMDTGDPRAVAARRVIRAMSTSTKGPDGIWVRGLYRPGAVEECVAALREIDPAAVDAALERIGLTPPKPRLDEIIKLVLPGQS